MGVYTKLMAELTTVISQFSYYLHLPAAALEHQVLPCFAIISLIVN
jgi:hypothetical protein